MTPKFSSGDPVTVAQANPPGHRRTPYYVRGRRGIVERVCAEAGNPEELAYGFDGLPKRRVYRVRFRQAELWPTYAGSASDTVDVDILEHWLQAVPSNEVTTGRSQ